MHAQLAANSRRVEAVVDAQLDGIERLFSAIVAEDWEAVARATRYLAEMDPDQFDRNIIRTAQQLFQELSGSQTEVKQPKHLASLLEACRAMRK